jgi:hypothetical protein
MGMVSIFWLRSSKMLIGVLNLGVCSGSGGIGRTGFLLLYFEFILSLSLSLPLSSSSSSSSYNI